MSAKLDPTPRRSEAVSQFRVVHVSPAQAEYLPKVKQEGFVKKVVALDVSLVNFRGCPMCSTKSLYLKLIEATNISMQVALECLFWREGEVFNNDLARFRACCFVKA